MTALHERPAPPAAAPPRPGPGGGRHRQRADRRSAAGIAIRPQRVAVRRPALALGLLPQPPDDVEKFCYVRRNLWVLTTFSLVSFDDLPLASILTPPLTTVHQPLHELGMAAADLLLNRLESPDEHQPSHVRLPTHLVVRESSGVPSASRTQS